MRNHLKWLQALTDGASGRSIAGASGIPVATVNRQISRGAFTAEVVIGIARAYGQSPVEALTTTGYLSPEEVIGTSIDAAAQLLTDQQLIREFARRLNSDNDAWSGTFDEVLTSHDINDLDSRREAKAATESAEPDYDAIVDGINAGTEKFAAQKATEPLEEHWP